MRWWFGVIAGLLSIGVAIWAVALLPRHRGPDEWHIRYFLIGLALICAGAALPTLVGRFQGETASDVNLMGLGLLLVGVTLVILSERRRK